MAFLKKLNIDKIKESVEAGVKSGVKAAQEGIASFDVDAAVQKAKDGIEGFDMTTAVKSAQESIASFDVDAAVQSAKDAAAAGASKIEEAVGRYRAEGDASEVPSYREFTALLWCLASVDGAVTAAERGKLAELALSLDGAYGEYSAELECECMERLEQGAREFGHAHAAKMEAQRLVELMAPDPRDARLICWNLLAVANVDGLDAAELDFIRFVGERAGVDAAAFEELCNYSNALVEIEAAREEMRASGRSYAEVEPLVNELAQREQVTIDAAQALVTDR